MRDIILFVIVFGALLGTLKHPHIGIYLWTWIGLMNPHRLAWGVAYSFPFAAVIGGVTLTALLFSKAKRKMPWSRETTLLLIFSLWMAITTVSAFSAEAPEYLSRVLKIQLFVFLTIYLIDNKEKLIGLIWVTVLSFGFYGIKGGVFTVLGGGVSRVWGPEDSFIGGNNEIGLALIMTIPLMTFLYFQEQNKLMRYVLGGGIFLTTLAIVGSQSRGALIGVIAMGVFLWIKSRNKLGVGLLIIVASIAIIMLMPEAWWERMSTIQNYQEDSSAMGRINAWWTAWNVASSNFFGGGFRMFTREIFLIYAPDPLNRHDAHSIYFQVLGEQGFVGLGLFLLLGITTWLRCGEIIRLAAKNSEYKWTADLAAMLQVSLIGYAASGAFLGLAYFDYYYHLIAITLITWGLLQLSVGDAIATSKNSRLHLNLTNIK